MYIIINKVECVQGKLIYTLVGYTYSKEIQYDINHKYEITLGAWINSNLGALTMGYGALTYEYNGGGNIYIAKTELVGPLTMLDGLTEITNLNQL